MTKMAFITSSLAYLCCLLLLAGAAAARDLKHYWNMPKTAVFAFGDSTADSGNNNKLFTFFKSNYYPYGKDYVGNNATGRFSNGCLMSDFIAHNLCVKDFVPPINDKSLTMDDLKTGVSFASAATGYDMVTSTVNNVISMKDQVSKFCKYKERLVRGIGPFEAHKVIERAFFFISAGTNDYMLNFPIQNTTKTFALYNKFLLRQTRNVVQRLIDEGARHIGVVGLPPMGCLPFMMTVYFKDYATCHKNGLSAVAWDYNIMLQAELEAMQRESRFCGARIAYLDSYIPLVEMITTHSYGFETVHKGCCGTGKMEAAYLCNKHSTVCNEVSKYLFWDSVHPTEKAYAIIARSFMPRIASLFRN